MPFHARLDATYRIALPLSAQYNLLALVLISGLIKFSHSCISTLMLYAPPLYCFTQSFLARFVTFTQLSIQNIYVYFTTLCLSVYVCALERSTNLRLYIMITQTMNNNTDYSRIYR